MSVSCATILLLFIYSDFEFALTLNMLLRQEDQGVTGQTVFICKYRKK